MRPPVGLTAVILAGNTRVSFRTKNVSWPEIVFDIPEISVLDGPLFSVQDEEAGRGPFILGMLGDQLLRQGIIKFFDSQAHKKPPMLTPLRPRAHTLHPGCFVLRQSLTALSAPSARQKPVDLPSYITYHFTVAGITQLVECKLPKLDAAGSSPVARSKLFPR